MTNYNHSEWEKELERRAHEIAVSLLPQILQEDNISSLSYNDAGGNTFNDEVMEDYFMIYRAALKSLEEEFEQGSFHP